MARKRSFSRDVITSTSFLDMPLSAQGLYFHLCMNADDDGFIDNSTSVARYCQATADDSNACSIGSLYFRFQVLM